MTSKEILEEAIKIQESNLTMVCEDNKPFCKQKINNYKQVLKDINELMGYIKDLKEENRKQKELLETELKLEKDKVKYVMKQLKKQDKILEILKEIFKYKAHSNWLFDYIKSKEQRSMIVDWLSEDLNNDR